MLVLKPQTISNRIIRRSKYSMNFIINLAILVLSLNLWAKIYYLISHSQQHELLRALLMSRLDKEILLFLIYSADNYPINYSSDLQDKYVTFFFDSISSDDIFYINVGAFDGITKSNTYLLESIGINGICIEANPKLTNILSMNRKCIVSSVGLVPTHNQRSSYIFEAKGANDIASSLVNVPKNTKNLTHILSVKDFMTKYKNLLLCYEHVYLSLDIEGIDFEILHDFYKYGLRPEIISIEHNHHLRTMQNINEFAKKNGYRIMFENFFRNKFVLTK